MNKFNQKLKAVDMISHLEYCFELHVDLIYSKSNIKESSCNPGDHIPKIFFHHNSNVIEIQFWWSLPFFAHDTKAVLYGVSKNWWWYHSQELNNS